MGTFTFDKKNYALPPTTLIVATHRLPAAALAAAGPNTARSVADIVAQHEDAKARLPRALVRLWHVAQSQPQ